ncbi:MAG TPA: hypothetical protein PLM20_03915 [Syntrophomonadaceae bacterium]|nr:hypothetical protein [Syntrophomonadaceae bacterium]HQE23028.1 hypothetical protein [Syntrophomonadaceae bacterium]
MKVGVICSGEQSQFLNFRTGDILENIPKHHLLESMVQLMKKYPYPGDLDPLSIDWVTNVALEVEQIYKPKFVFLSYASYYLISLFKHPGLYDRQALRQHLFAEVERFFIQTGLTPFIIGTGGTLPLEGEVDLTELDGFVTASRLGPVYAGLYQPSQRDLYYLNQLEAVQMILPQERFAQVWIPPNNFEGRIPDYFMVAARGFAFGTPESSKRPLYRVNARDNKIPIYAPDTVKSIIDIAPAVKKRLRKERVALVVLEGIDHEHFAFGNESCSNTYSWYTYLPGEGQYLAMTTGRHILEHPYPPGYRDYQDPQGKTYPFSGYYRSLPIGTIGSLASKTSIAVGSRSVLTHAASGADICIEGYTRSMKQEGTLGVIDINKTRKGRTRRR